MHALLEEMSALAADAQGTSRCHVVLQSTPRSHTPSTRRIFGTWKTSWQEYLKRLHEKGMWPPSGGGDAQGDAMEGGDAQEEWQGAF